MTTPPHSRLRRVLVGAALFLAAASSAVGLTALRTGAPLQQDELRRTLAEAGIEIDLEAKILALPALVRVKNDLLEYVLVGPSGAGHESLFLTSVRPSLVNAALLLLGVEPGRNARLVDTGELDERGRPKRDVEPPEGDGFYLYAGWREGEEVYFYRLEDLVRNLASGRGLRRHRWVYLGSRFHAFEPDAPESFMADLEGNLINLAFFFQGNTLLTAALEECIEQSIWAANEWLLPASGEPVHLFFSREPLAALPPAFVPALPEASGPPPGEGR